MIFSCTKEENENYSKPRITTSEISELAFTTATCGGNIISDAYKSIMAKGVVWSTSENPNLDSNEGMTNDGTGNLHFTSSITELKEATLYYVLAYATTEEGTFYGEQKSFETKWSKEMISVQGGTFQMGSNDGYDEKPIHTVTLSSFEIGKYEVTQARWVKVMGSNPSAWVGYDRPVESASWDDVQIFITNLNEQTGLIYRLPTEAEWEFAARGGNSSNGYTYSGSNTIGDVAWYSHINSTSGTHVIGTKQANELGIHDMSGNVWEWCNDWYSGYGSNAITNPQGAESGSYRVFRGGVWSTDASHCRITVRDYYYYPSGSNYSVGFRLARSL